MKIRQSIFNRGKQGGDTGRIENTWTLRLAHTDERENKTSKTWQYATKQDAKDDFENRKAEMILFVESKGLDLGDIKTFRQWAEYAKADFYRPAVIKEGRKVAGIKAHRQTHILIDQLIECFGNKPLAKFTKYDLDRYKVWRLETGDRRGAKGKLEPKQRNAVTISTANRGLAILKHLLIEAHDAGLIAKNVTKGSKAIDSDAETARTRTLTDAEEMRLLASCKGKRIVAYNRKGKAIAATVEADNPHLKAVILLGLDSGMRRGEILTLEWQDIDFDADIIKILGTHTKTQKARSVPMTRRTKAELFALPNFGTSGRVFPFNDFKRSWATTLRIAGIDGITFHDLRRTFVTRLQTGGVSIGIAAELAGHSRLETTQKHYTSTDNVAVIQDAAARINAANDSRL
ncbi:MAG: site-specific integrase, partial [Acidobacteriota bacterium]|nr:site-specific integrase [Acidobacteriota bacterium]